MSTLTSRLALYKPAGGENINVTTDLNNNLDKIDQNLNFRVAANATARNAISPFWEGLNVRETDTGDLYISNGTPPISASWDKIHSVNTYSSILNISVAGTASTGIRIRVGSDANNKLQIRGTGALEWGAGGGTAVDTVLYRSAADTLRTADNLIVDQLLTASGGATIANGATITGGASISGTTTAGAINSSGAVTGTSLSTSGNLTAGNITTGAWTSYTPTWSSSGTQPAIGNGSITGRYMVIGKTCTVTISVNFGTTTTFGTNAYMFSLPFTDNTGATNYRHIGQAEGHNSTTWFSGTVSVQQGQNTARIHHHTSGGDWSNSIPVTWTAATTDYINMTLTYETT